MGANLTSRRSILFAGLSAAGGLAIGVPWPSQAAASTKSSPVVSDGSNAAAEMTASAKIFIAAKFVMGYKISVAGSRKVT